jgi:phospho-N-acetylmuramoyl-pentapeptide-transferase
MNAFTPAVSYGAIGGAIVLVAGAPVIRLLRALQVRQHAYEDAPATHRAKTGTPTMGGVLFVAALVPLLFADLGAAAAAIFWTVAGCAAIGFLDDLLAVRRAQNRGLRARSKYLATMIIGLLFLSRADALGVPHDVLVRAGAFTIHAPHAVWVIVCLLALTGTMHAVNLTDGLDGLAAGSMIPPLVVTAVLGAAFGNPTAAAASALGAGACAAFLVFNRHPARLFMGDTGSLALGALLACVAIMEGEVLLLPVIGAVFVAEALSVIAQVAYFKATGGKRLLRMSPLHHHFELGGMKEPDVTYRFWLASAVGSALGWAIAR